MTDKSTDNNNIVIRPVQYRDLEAITDLACQFSEAHQLSCSITLERQLQKFKDWYGVLKFLQLFPNPFQHYFCGYVAELEEQVAGLIQVSPFNSTCSTWRVDKVIVDPKNFEPELGSRNKGIGSQLLRHCFETIWEARTWLLEVNINQKSILALYRQNGFQPLAQMTYWSISPERLTQMASREPDLPNLLPVSNADAQLLYQLDTVSMPPLLRQVFDRHIQDFKTNVFAACINKFEQWLNNTQVTSAYVFEPQRKAAIGYFRLETCKYSSRPHVAQLTVHPAYTWLYPQLLTQMAKLVKGLPPQCLELASADYQPEREEYLEKLGAIRIEHTLLMSRSVWHKLKESKPLEGLSFSDVLQGLQPARTPIPSRMSWLKSTVESEQKTSLPQNPESSDNNSGESPDNGKN